MSASAPPFAARHYPLARCALALLEDAAEARELAEMLAGLEPWRTLGYTTESLASYLDRHDPALRRFRIVAGAATVGIVCIRYPWVRGPYIELIGFAPAGRAQGFGRDVVAWMEDQVLGHAANLWAVVSSFNEPARRFYAKHGFIEIAALNELAAPGYDEILVRKVLT
jgi:ribosomal protein S18 acetylase RimI-like enzyme